MNKIIFAFALTACIAPVFAQQNHDTAGVILSHFSAGPAGFAAGAIPRADLDTIILAGVRAPSAMNRQPWFFTVVQDQNLAKKMGIQIVEGNALIVISAEGDGKTNAREIFDCGLATQSIYLAAQALGYGSRIYTGSIDSVNKTLKKELGIPNNRSAIAMVRIGKTAEQP
jgi:nitroreductase